MPSGDRDPSTDRKNRGAYYTDPAGAAALCAWSIRKRGDTVLDPSFGAGVFLRAAAARLAELGGSPTQVHGVEMDPAAHATGSAAAETMGIPAANLARRDFFAVAADARFAAVVGNPPFIRFQRFKGASRERALRKAREAGVELSPLASSWAPFLIHATRCLAAGGHMALVVPRELGSAEYGRDVLAFLAATFARVTLVSSRVRWFPHVDQDTYALLASGRGEPGGDIRLAQIDRPEDLPRGAGGGEHLDVDALVRGERTPRFFGLSAYLRTEVEAVEAHPGGVRLGTVATVTSGYVSGANAFFHLSPDAADAHGLGKASLSRAVFRSRALSGLAFDDDDWHAAARDGGAGYLFTPGRAPDDAARAYIASGVSSGADRGYKARNRAEWWVVPRVATPDLLLAAMASDTHALAVNKRGAAPANTLHAVTLAADASSDGAAGAAPWGDVPGRDSHGMDMPGRDMPAGGVRTERNRAIAQALAVGWVTSASRLSRELTGRVLGGGMLKLQPGECARIWIPDPRALDPDAVARTAPRIDALLRQERLADAERLADRCVLQDALGLPADVVYRLAEAADALREQRRRTRTDPDRGSRRAPS